MLKLLFLGDIVGEPGRKAVIEMVPRWRDERGIDFVVVNGENSANGRGITPKICTDLLRAKVAVITSGDHIWDQKEIVPHLDMEPRLLRPINYPPATPGRGSIVLDTPKGKVAVINVQGRTFMQPPLENPFLAMQAEVERLRQETRVLFVDMHAETTSEKMALGWYLDGKVSAVVGTHTHVQTADERILPGGTAYLTDAGMTGPHDGVIGMDRTAVIARFMSGLPVRFEPATGDARLHGVAITADPITGKATAIERVALTEQQLQALTEAASAVVAR